MLTDKSFEARSEDHFLTEESTRLAEFILAIEPTTPLVTLQQIEDIYLAQQARPRAQKRPEKPVVVKRFTDRALEALLGK